MRKFLIASVMGLTLAGSSYAEDFVPFAGVSDSQVISDWKDAKTTCAHGNPMMSGTTQSCALINDAARALYDRGYRYKHGHWMR